MSALSVRLEPRVEHRGAPPELRLVGGTDGTSVEPPADLRAEQRDRPQGGERWRDRTRFAVSLALVLVLYGSVAFAVLHFAPDGEARASGGSDTEVVIDGVSVVMMDSMASETSPDVPEPVKTPAPERVEAPTPPDAAVDAPAPVAESMPEQTAAAPEMPEPSHAPPGAVTAAAAPETWPAPETSNEATLEQTPVAHVGAIMPAADRIAPAPADETAPKPEQTIAEPPPKQPARPVTRALQVKPAAPVVAAAQPQAPPTKLPKPSKPAAARDASLSQPTAKGPKPGAAGAAGISAEERGSASLSSYEAKLAAHLRRFRIYPAEAEARGLTGVAMVSFTVRRDGGLAAVRLTRGSGYAVLDDAALAMVRRAAPFPPMPETISSSTLSVAVPVNFDRPN
jgi:protein TonB